MNQVTASRSLRWLERLLLLTGLTLCLWCGFVAFDSWRVNRSTIDDVRLSGLVRLPGEESSSVSTVVAGTLLARLDAPSVALSTAVLEGSDDRTLRRAAGHIEHTAQPGARGNVGIAGHRDTVFRPVRKLKIGDSLILTVPGSILEYRVSMTRIVNPDAVDVLNPTHEPTLTLVTCYPFTFIGSAPQRFIVTATLVHSRRS